MAATSDPCDTPQFENDVEKVCNFLKNRNVDIITVDNFRMNKMDTVAVWKASEEDLKSLGLKERGHLICLKSFCMPESESIGKSLTESVKDAGRDIKKKKSNISLSNPSCSNSQQQTKAVLLGWMHFNPKTSKYSVVRAHRGGGNRKLMLPTTATKEDLIKEARKMFFPNDTRDWHDMLTDLGNYQGHVVRDDFILDDYIRKHKLTKTRLYILTRYKPIKDRLLHISDDDDNDDDDFFIPAFDSIQTSTVSGSLMSQAPAVASIPASFPGSTSFSPRNGTGIDSTNMQVSQVITNALSSISTNMVSNLLEPDNLANVSLSSPLTTNVSNFMPSENACVSLSSLTTSNNNYPAERRNIVKPVRFRHSIGSPSLSQRSDMLIGTNDERQKLRQELEDAFNQSLIADQAKQRNQTDKLISNEQNELAVALQMERKKQMIDEPDLETPHVVVTVQHPDKGCVRRIFPTGQQMVVVYNWVGSLALEPIHFQLSTRENKMLLPYEIITQSLKSALFVQEVEHPVYEVNENDLFDYADEEAHKFIEDMAGAKTDALPIHDEVQCAHDSNTLAALFKQSKDLLPFGRCAIVHRRPSSFWPILFRQGNYEQPVTRVIWAGEPCADDGGPYREFLLACMENFHLLSMECFGTAESLFLKVCPDSIITRKYFMLGQLSGLAIINLSRGPHCLHHSLVDYIYSRQVLKIEPSEIKDIELQNHVHDITMSNYDCLLNSNILPSNSVQENIDLFVKNYCILANDAAISQYKEGVQSVCPEIFDYPCCTKRFFVEDNTTITYFDIRKNMEFQLNAETGSNEALARESTVLTVELFLQKLEQGIEGLNLRDFLKFVAAIDRIPFTGLSKSIDIFITPPSNRLPSSSTCGLLLYVPENVTEEKLLLSLKEGLGFGNI